MSIFLGVLRIKKIPNSTLLRIHVNPGEFFYVIKKIYILLFRFASYIFLSALFKRSSIDVTPS